VGDSSQLDVPPRVAHGEPLLVWGEYDGDALRVRDDRDLAVALDAIHAISMIAEPVVLRVWSPADDQVVAVVNGDACALYVVESPHGYGTSVGDPARTETFEVVDRHAGRLTIAWRDCVSWSVARAALIEFAYGGRLGANVSVEGAIPSQLLSLAEIDRDAELASRSPATDPALTSLPAKSPCGAWAERLLAGLLDLHLIEIDRANVETITARVAILLQQTGADAQDAIESARKLAGEIKNVSGVAAVFATPADLQIALRRTQDPPTEPVEVRLP